MVLSKNRYHIPFPRSTIVEEIYTASPAHSGASLGAIDFRVPVGTWVASSLGGVVVDAIDFNAKWGNKRQFAMFANYITIQHNNDEFTQYVHLAQNSLTIKIGEKVKTGQILAATGLSGWMSTPHLHFFVFRNVKGKPGFEGLAAQFKV